MRRDSPRIADTRRWCIVGHSRKALRDAYAPEDPEDHSPTGGEAVYPRGEPTTQQPEYVKPAVLSAWEGRGKSRVREWASLRGADTLETSHARGLLPTRDNSTDRSGTGTMSHKDPLRGPEWSGAGSCQLVASNAASIKRRRPCGNEVNYVTLSRWARRGSAGDRRMPEALRAEVRRLAPSSRRYCIYVQKEIGHEPEHA